MNLQEYAPRQAFLPLHNRTKRWAVVIAHRRAGKTVSMCADLVIGALETALPKPSSVQMKMGAGAPAAKVDLPMPSTP